MTAQQKAKETKQTRPLQPKSPQPISPDLETLAWREPVEVVLQRAFSDPETISPHEAQRLQQAIGNKTVKQLEAKETAASSPSSNSIAHHSLQAILGQTAVLVQNASPPKIQPKLTVDKPDNADDTIPPDIEANIQQSRGGGQPSANPVRGPMEQAFSTDFSGVKIHTNSQSDALNQSLSARAFTTGSDIFFRRGEYDPDSSGGQELLAHELTHVVQQGAAGQLQREPDSVVQRRRGEETAVESPAAAATTATEPAENGNTATEPPAGTSGTEPGTTQAEAVAEPAENGEVATASPAGTNGTGPGTAQVDTGEGAGGDGGETAVSPNGTAPAGGAGSQPATAESGAAAAGPGSPASAAEDPGFQAVTERAAAAATEQTSHQEAAAAAVGAQAAAPSPGNEVASQAAAVQVDEMNAQKAQPFDKQAFKEALLARIAELTPETLEDADDFPDDNNLDAMQSELSSEIDESRAESGEDIAETAEEAPDTGAIAPRQPEPLQPEEAGPPPTDIGAQEAAPPPRTEAEVEAPIQEGSQELDQQMEEANITEDQLASANEPEFTAALDARQEAHTAAAETPTAYRQEEQGMVAQAQTQAADEATTGLTGMNAERTAVLEQVVGEQAATSAADEAERAAVADRIEEIYGATQQAVEDRLAQLDEEVDAAFTQGATAAQEAFENHHRSRMEAYKDERYDGIEGAALWLSDKIFGMPDEVNAFYQEGRSLYIERMDQVLNNIAETVSVGLTAAKTLIAQGRQEVQAYVAGLPESLRQVGAEAAGSIQSRFDELDQRVDDKQGELIDSLAQRYNENLQAIDARIEALQAENRGLVDAALDAMGGVIETILELKAMLENVLARAAGAIEMIIADPVGFLGNLIAGVQLGLENFLSNIGEHLQTGLIGWLTGALTEAGIELPETWNLAGIFQLVMQVLGLSFESIMGRVSNLLGFDIMGVWDTIQELIGIYQEGGLAGLAEHGLAQLVGEDNMAMLMSVVEIIQVIIEGDFGRLWGIVREHLSNLKEMIFGQITEFITERVIRAGITWVISLFNPAGAFVRACMMIYDVIMFFVERGRQIMALVTAVIDSVASIAQGNISVAANFIEQALARAVPVAISFLASLLGLGGISDRVREIIQSVQGMVDSALDAVFNSGPVQAVARFLRRIIARVQSGIERVGSAIGFGEEEVEENLTEDQETQLATGLAALQTEEAKYVENGKISRHDSEQVAFNVRQQHQIFQTIHVVDGRDSWDYEYVVQRAKEDTGTTKAEEEESPINHDELAASLGYRKTNYRSHGQPVYKKGRRYISPDIDSHIGGIWKMADSVKNLGSKRTRMGTYDKDLNRIGD